MPKYRTTIYWGICQINDWKLYIAKTERGLCYIGSPNRPFSELEAWINKKLPHAILVQSDSSLQKEMLELEQYMRVERDSFTVEIDLIGTDFQKEVWHASNNIPYGETRTYSDIANVIGRPNAVRAVGTAIGANPLLMMIPCHRIVAKDGGLAGFRAELNMKRFLLALEATPSDGSTIQ